MPVLDEHGWSAGKTGCSLTQPECCCRCMQAISNGWEDDESRQKRTYMLRTFEPSKLKVCQALQHGVKAGGHATRLH
jgi:hypothetical protein